MRIVVLLVAVVPFVWACGRPAPQGEVAAKVNGNEIAVEQLRRAVAASPAAPGAAKPTPAQVMDAMIDEELLAQKALNLIFDPRCFVTAVEGLKSKISHINVVGCRHYP